MTFKIEKSLVKSTPESIALTSYGAKTTELQLHDRAHKALEDNKLFDPGGVYSPAQVSAALIRKGGDRVIYWQRVYFSSPSFELKICVRYSHISTAVHFSHMTLHSAVFLSVA